MELLSFVRTRCFATGDKALQSVFNVVCDDQSVFNAVCVMISQCLMLCV